jgi:hypothetical protein
MFRMSDPEDKKPWNPAKFKCPKCETVIWSRYPGQFCGCKCGDCFVDQTRYYSRHGGDVVLVEQGTREDE